MAPRTLLANTLGLPGMVGWTMGCQGATLNVGAAPCPVSSAEGPWDALFPLFGGILGRTTSCSLALVRNQMRGNMMRTRKALGGIRGKILLCSCGGILIICLVCCARVRYYLILCFLLTPAGLQQKVIVCLVQKLAA